VPQAPVPLRVTVSPTTDVPLGLATVVVIVAVSVPFATRTALVVPTVTVFGGAVIVMLVEPVAPWPASIAFSVQVPVVFVVLAVYVIVT
jgi:hypothetical protein